MALGTATLRLTKKPQHVRLTTDSLIVPKGTFSREELELPLSETDIKIFDIGLLKQLQLKHRRRKVVLVSARFPSDAEFNRLVSHLHGEDRKF